MAFKESATSYNLSRRSPGEAPCFLHPLPLDHRQVRILGHLIYMQVIYMHRSTIHTYIYTLYVYVYIYAYILYRFGGALAETLSLCWHTALLLPGAFESARASEGECGRLFC